MQACLDALLPFIPPSLGGGSGRRHTKKQNRELRDVVNQVVVSLGQSLQLGKKRACVEGWQPGRCCGELR